MSYIGNPIVSTDFPVDYKSGNGSTTAFTLSVAPASVNSIDVQISGVSQSPQTYSVSGTTLTFSAAPPSGTNNIVVRHLGIAGVPNVPATASVTSASLAAQDLVINGVTVGKGGGAVSGNTAVGYQSLNTNSTANNNTAVGYQALYSTSTGERNTAVGRGALYTNTGSYNTAFGDVALNGNTTGTQNLACAIGSLQNNTTGSYNVALGSDALKSNTTASNNTAVGYQAGYSNTTGTGMTFIGQAAGYSTTTANNSTYVGVYAGNATTGSNNTFVGTSAGEVVTSGASNTIIGRYNGNQGGLDIRTASNYIVLSDGNGNPRAYWNGNGTLSTTANPTADVAAYIQNANASTPYGMYISFTATAPNNTSQYFLTCTDNSLERMKIYSNGNIVNRNNSYGALSDAKLKENIVDTTPKLDKLMQVKVRNFNMIGDDLKQIGFVAQELETVFPSLVIDTPDTETTEDGVKELGTTTKEVKTTVLIPILVKAIQELKAEVDSLKATTEAQALEIQALKGTV